MKILLNHSQVKGLHEKYPDFVGVLFSPSKTRFYGGEIPYAMDNGAFSGFDSELFLKVLARSKEFNPPMFIVCPDVVADHSMTIRLWHQWQPELKKFNYPIAFVAQDGCGLGDVPLDADWVFIGGSDRYKEWAITNLKTGKLTHCGRVNNYSRLWKCFNHGIDSVDGSGWFKSPGRKRDRDLLDFLQFQASEKQHFEGELFPVRSYCR
jgi:hypothetical protein